MTPSIPQGGAFGPQIVRNGKILSIWEVPSDGNSLLSNTNILLLLHTWLQTYIVSIQEPEFDRIDLVQ